MDVLKKANPRGNYSAPVWILAMITLSGTLAMHIFVPALPLAANDLAASSAALQLTISVYIAGLAVGQLIYGPLSDRFGRRPVLAGGLCLYTAAGVLCAVAWSVEMLIVARAIQALGGCAGMVLGRAIARDTNDETDATRRMAIVNLIVTLGPGMAPLVGAAIASNAGWRTIFILTVLLGATNVYLTLGKLKETSASEKQASWSRVTQNYHQLVKTREFVLFALGGALATTSWYAFLTSAPFILVRELDSTLPEIGTYLALMMLFVCIGSAVTGRLSRRYSAKQLLLSGATVSFVGTILFVALVAATGASLFSIMAPMCMVSIGVGMTSAPAIVAAISINTTIIGSAAGLYGFMQMASGTLVTAIVSTAWQGALAVSILMLVAHGCAIGLILAAARRSKPT